MSKNMSTVRKTNARKQLQAEIRALKAIESALVKARVAIESNSHKLGGDTFNQMADVFAKLGNGIVVTDTAQQDAAHKLVNIIVGK